MKNLKMRGRSPKHENKSEAEQMTIRQRATSNISTAFRTLLCEKTAACSTTLDNQVPVTEAMDIHQTTGISKPRQVELVGITQSCFFGVL